MKSFCKTENEKIGRLKLVGAVRRDVKLKKAFVLATLDESGSEMACAMIEKSHGRARVSEGFSTSSQFRNKSILEPGIEEGGIDEAMRL
jgi:hypothetical protein